MIPDHNWYEIPDQYPPTVRKARVERSLLPAHSKFREDQNGLAGQVSQASQSDHLHGKGARLNAYIHYHEIPDS